MKRSRPDQRSGAALIMTLILVTAIAMLVISYYAITRQEATVSSATVSLARADLGEKAAFAEAGALLRRLTANDRYLVSVVTRSGGDGQPMRHTYVSTPDANGVTHTALFSGGGEKRVNLPNLDALETAALIEAPVAAPEYALEGDVAEKAIHTYPLTHLTEAGATVKENRFPAVAFRELEAAGDSPFRTRYAYWIEDLEGYPNPDAVGAWTDQHETADGKVARDPIRYGYGPFDSRRAGTGPDGAPTGRYPLEGEPNLFFQFPTEFRGQSLLDQVAPGLSPREIALVPWSTASLSAGEHPYAGAMEKISHRYLFATGAADQASAGNHEPGRFAGGLQSYRRRPIIPFAHGYADEGKPRYNLNVLVANRDLSIADLVERNLPNFKNRRGGFPEDEDYVATLAANAIDYADKDSLPALPGNTVNAGTRVFRGVDSYCPVNEFFVKFEYVGYEVAGNQFMIVFEATPYVEFWNPSNREAKMEQVRLKFSFLERIRFRANGRDHEILEVHRESDEAFPETGGLTVTIPPNDFEVIAFGKIKWKVPVPRDSDSPIAFPVVQDIRGYTNVSVRANYELYLGGDLVDRCGRRDPADPAGTRRHGFFFGQRAGVMSADQFFMRLATPNMAAKAFGFNAGDGSHLGDPWMPYYSRATAEDLQYRLKGSPGSRNYDSSKINLGRPDWFKDQTRVRDWPDRGYDKTHGPYSPANDTELPDTFNLPQASGDGALAPWRLSNLGRFYSVTELGNLHDPVMWIPGPPSILTQNAQRYDTYRNTTLKSLPIDAPPGKVWGGGNTLRIGRPEHERFDRPGMRASQWLDLFHTGFTGTNLAAEGGVDLYATYDPRDHQPPAAASDPVESGTQPYSVLYDSDLHAQGLFALVDGHLNVNSAPTAFEIEMLLRGPFVSSDVRIKEDRFDTPIYSREGETGTLRSGLRTEAIPLIAAGLMKVRPFYSPSHLARVLSGLIDQHDALPDHHNDAEAEETFARLFNTTTLSSRHFRIFTSAEIYHHETGEVTGRSRRVHEVFLRPTHAADGEVESSRLEVISSRDL